MHHHARRLVDNHQRIVFVHHIEWNVFGLDGRVVVRSVEHQRNHIARPYLVIAFHGAFVYVHETRVGGLLYAVTTGMLQPFCHKSVDTHGHLSLIHHYAQVFVQLPRVVVLFFYLLYIVGHALLLLKCASRPVPVAT